MSVASSDVCEGESETGKLLADLERRQDDVLAQLDVLDQQLSTLLRGLGVTLIDEAEATGSSGDLQPGSDVGNETVNPPASIDRFAADDHDQSNPSAIGFARLPSDRPAGSGPARAA